MTAHRLFDTNLGMQPQIAELKHFLASALGENPEDTPCLIETRSAPYFNGRERGFYLGIMVGSNDPEYKGPFICENLVFFEHRNSDNIILLRWQTNPEHKWDFKFGGYEPVTVKDIPDEIYPDKYHYTKSWDFWDFKSVALYVRKIYCNDDEE